MPESSAAFDPSLISKNQRLQLHYPAKNDVCRPIEFRPRELIIHKMRDLRTNPLTPEEFLRRPTLYRGRYLVLATCVSKSGAGPGGAGPGGAGVGAGRPVRLLRQFYPSASRDLWRPSQVRLALFDATGEIAAVISRGFDPAPASMAALSTIIQKIQRRKDFGDLLLRIIVDDLRLHRVSG